MSEPIHVLITGAAGQIGYVLAFRLANGELFGEQRIILHLLEIPQAMKALEGTVLELQDGAFPSLAGVIWTDNIEKAFKNVEVAFLVGAFPRKEGMERGDLLEKNGAIFQAQGRALADFAKPNVKVLVVGNPANTNALIALNSAPGLGPQNFSAMTRLDYNRIKGELAAKLNVGADDIKNVIIWGNHSSTQVPDVSHGTVKVKGGEIKNLVDVLEPEYYQGELISKVASRGGAVIKLRGASSAASAANAALNHMQTWVKGTPEGEYVSAAIPVPESAPYGVKPGVVFSFPVTVVDGQFQVVEGLEISEFYQNLINISEQELIGEKELAWKVLDL